jgi:glucose-6-phosphate dehydrogenase assembly protein OpcA
MSTYVYKVLGQVNPSANTLTTLYTVPASNSAVLSTISICNLGSTAATFRVAVRPNGDAIANKHYLNYDTAIPGNDSITATLGITLANNDVISVNATSASITFNAFGSEIY